MRDADLVLDQIDVDLIEAAWPLLEPFFRRATVRVSTDWTPEAIRREAEGSRMALWAIYDRREPLKFLGAAASVVRDVRGEKVAVMAHCAGRDFARWGEQVLAEFERLAEANGCVRVEAEGRPGWARRLPGYRVARVILEKVL